MKLRIDVLAAAVCGATALFGTTAASAATACAELKNLKLPDTTITSAEGVPAGELKVPGGFGPPGTMQALKVPAMCRLAGVVTPAIKFEVWLPEGNGWNGRYQAVGGGGLAGIISYPARAGAVRGGYATSSTDPGQEASVTPDKGTLDRQR